MKKYSFYDRYLDPFMVKWRWNKLKHKIKYLLLPKYRKHIIEYEKWCEKTSPFIIPSHKMTMTVSSAKRIKETIKRLKIEIFTSSLEIGIPEVTIRLKKPLKLRSNYITYKDEENNEYYLTLNKPFICGYGKEQWDAYKNFQELFCLEYLEYKLGNYSRLAGGLKNKIEEFDKLIKWVHYKVNDVYDF